MYGFGTERGPGARARRRQSGFTLVEVAVAAATLVLALALGGAALGFAQFQQSRARATNIAVSVLRDKLAEIQAKADTDMPNLYAYYANRTFTVPAIPGVREGLTPVPVSQANPSVLRGYVGKIYCWNDETGASMPAGATAGDSGRLGLPLDLNMDDDADDASLIGVDMKVVPMKIVLEFQSAGGGRASGAYGTDAVPTQRVEVFFLAGPQK